MPAAWLHYYVGFIAGFVFSLTALGLSALTFTGFFIRLRTAGYLHAINVLAFVLLAASTVVGYTYIAEAWVVLHSHNPYEKYAFLRSRVAGPLTDLAHLIYPAFERLPWAPYWWAYYFMLIASLCPQFFWIPVFRRRLPLAFCVALVAVLGSYLERLITFCARLL